MNTEWSDWILTTEDFESQNQNSNQEVVAKTAKELQFSLRNKSKAPSEQTYSYNQKNQLTELVSLEDISDKNLGYRLLYKYDEVGNIIRMEQTRINGDYFYAEEYTYNEKNELISAKEFDHNGRIAMHYSFVYTYF